MWKMDKLNHQYQRNRQQKKYEWNIQKVQTKKQIGPTRSFELLVFSVDKVTGQETKAFIKGLAKYLLLKWNCLFLMMIVYTLTDLSITRVSTICHTMWGSRIPVKDMSYMLPVFEDWAGMSLMVYGANFIIIILLQNNYCYVYTQNTKPTWSNIQIVTKTWYLRKIVSKNRIRKIHHNPPPLPQEIVLRVYIYTRTCLYSQIIKVSIKLKYVGTQR